MKYLAQCVLSIGLASLAVTTTAQSGSGYAAWRAQAAHALSLRNDSESLAAAAALTFLGAQTRTGAVELAARAADLAPDNPAITWLRLHICANVTGCDTRDAATTMRWVDPDNAAAWLPTLAIEQKDRDTVQLDHILAEMAQGKRFDFYINRTTVMIFDALKRARAALPAHYAATDLGRLTEAIGIADAAVRPSFTPLINACADTAVPERREACLRLSKTMQKADAVMTQLVGFAIERRLNVADAREQRSITERRRRLEWRASTANLSDTPLLPWLRNARARSRLALLRRLPREEDVYVALLRAHGMPLEPPEEHR